MLFCCCLRISEVLHLVLLHMKNNSIVLLVTPIRGKLLMKCYGSLLLGKAAYKVLSFFRVGSKGPPYSSA
uniref:Uncharacterized protein n=1 Tax=Arundo donax TaxID=35708 RepID=A0A0A9F7I2_ARUDO